MRSAVCPSCGARKLKRVYAPDRTYHLAEWRGGLLHHCNGSRVSVSEPEPAASAASAPSPSPSEPAASPSPSPSEPMSVPQNGAEPEPYRTVAAEILARNAESAASEPEPEPAASEPAAFEPEPVRFTRIDADRWVDFCHAVRDSVAAHELRYIVSARAIVGGIDLIKAGITPQRAAEMLVWKGMPRTDRERVASDARVRAFRWASAAYVPPASMAARSWELLAALRAGVNVMVVGPAGSGKTMVAREIALALGRERGLADADAFFATSCGVTTSKDDLIGFVSAANGDIVHGFLRRPYQHGGSALLDEIDACNADGLLGMNQCASNGHASFADGVIERHPFFALIASANTFGRGADRQYVGRSELDAATLDRFAVIEWDYDRDAERRWALERFAQ